MNASESLYNFGNSSRTKLDRDMFKFTLKLYNNPLLSRKAVDDIINNLNDFISDSFIPFVQNRVEVELKPKVDKTAYYSTQNILESSKNMFNKFSSEHLRFKLYEQESLYVPPETFAIGEVPFYDIDETNVQVLMKTVYATYISLIKTLKAVLGVPGVFKQIEDYVIKLSKETSTLSNVMQGDLWKKKICSFICIRKDCFPFSALYG